MTSVTPASLLAEALGVAPSDISNETALESCASWDSMAHFRIVAALEELLCRPLTPTEIFDVVDFDSVESLLTAKSEK